MDKLTFTSEVIKAIAWPTATVILGCISRKPLTKMLQLLKKLKYGDLEAEFTQAVDEAEQAAAKAQSAGEFPDREPGTTLLGANEPDRLTKMLEISPRGAVLEAWVEFELTTQGFSSRFAESPKQFSAIVNWMKANGLLKPNQVTLVQKLRQIRNFAAHESDEVSSIDAARFIDLIRPLITYVKNIERQANAVGPERFLSLSRDGVVPRAEEL